MKRVVRVNHPFSIFLVIRDQWQVLQLVAWQLVQAEFDEDETVLPPEENPKADISLRGELAPHWGQITADRSIDTETSSSNLFWHLVHSNS